MIQGENQFACSEEKHPLPSRPSRPSCKILLPRRTRRARRGGSMDTFTGLRSTELPQKTGVVFKEHAQVTDAVLEHGHPFHAEAEGESGPGFGIIIHFGV